MTDREMGKWGNGERGKERGFMGSRMAMGIGIGVAVGGRKRKSERIGPGG